jgi:hypothetical protein
MRKQILSILILFPFVLYGQQWKPKFGNLQTEWADDVTPNTAWQQYPRPQLERDEWKNLNGLWDFIITSDSLDIPKKFNEKILVPFPVESALSGVKKKVGKGNKLWYKTTFSVPLEWKGKQVALHFEASDWETEVWLNGEKLGAHKGGYDHFKFILNPNQLKVGNELIVGVTDLTDNGWQALGKQVENPGGIFYTSVTGLWQTVWLEPLSNLYLESFKIHTNIDKNNITIIPQVKAQKKNYKIKTTVSFNGKFLASQINESREKITILLPETHLWTPENPNLYDLKIELLKGRKTLDCVNSYFGMRSVKVAKANDGFNRIFLNNKPVFHNGPLDQGYWPDGIYTPPTEEAMAYDLKIIKKLGFNMLRKHVKVESRRFYYLCDKIGLMVWQDMPNGDKKIWPQEPDINRTKESADQFEYELRKLIEDHYNNPSIVMWTLFNEGWGQYDTERITKYVKKLDPSRIVNSASGWADRKVGDVHDLHSYIHPTSPEPEEHRAVVLGEFGGFGLSVKGHMWETENWGYGNLKTGDDLINLYEKYFVDIWKLQKTKGLSASVYTQITDVETETNGLLTYDRKVLKVNPNDMKDLNTNNFIAMPIIRPNGGMIFHKDKVFLDNETNEDIRYTLDGSEPLKSSPIYQNGIYLNKSGTVKAKVFSGSRESRTAIAHFNSTEKPSPIYMNNFSPSYPAGGNYALINGITGGSVFNDGNWQGFYGVDADVTIDLNQRKKVETISISAIQHQLLWIFFPKSVSISVSIDGIKYKVIKVFKNNIKPSDENEIMNYSATLGEEIRYVRISADNLEICPDWHLGNGGKAWLFLDEISIK